MMGTYRAIEVTKPGVFTEVSRPLQDPGPNQVRIRVEACGVCHTDSLLVNEELPNLPIRAYLGTRSSGASMPPAQM
jgi:alcohol dehydrogenase, propanol-preferring